MPKPPNYTPPIGGLALDRYTAQQHFNGTAFRHTADQTDLDSPGVVIGNTTYTNVETAIVAIASNINNLNNFGATQGFITIPDGYDTYHNANGTINFDNTVPALDTFLNPLFNQIVTNTLPTNYTRLKDGGIIVIKSGTYIIKNTVLVPPGITIIGEGFGTKIVNATALNTSVSPPVVSGTPAPVFQIQPDLNRLPVDGAIDPNMFMFVRETRIWNLVISDNFVEPTLLGDHNYVLPQNSSGNTPLIQQQNGSNLSLSNVFLMGRVTFSSGTVVSAATTFAIQLNTSVTAPNGTILSIDKCFIDGFSIPIQWLSTGDTATPVNRDFLSITNSKIRGYGYLTGDSSSAIHNSIVVMNDNNAVVSNNIIYGNAANILSLVFMNNHLPSSPTLQGRSKVNVVNNTITVNRAGNATNTTFTSLLLNASNFTFFSKITSSPYSSVIATANNFQDQLSVNADGSITLLSENVNIISSLSYTVTDIAFGSIDRVLAINIASAIITLPLAANNNGRTLIIKDYAGTASISTPIAILTQGSDTIEVSGPSSYSIETPYTSITFISNGGTVWSII